MFLNGFATNADGLVTVRCEAPNRTPGGSGGDPLFAEQWHLRQHRTDRVLGSRRHRRCRLSHGGSNRCRPERRRRQAGSRRPRGLRSAIRTWPPTRRRADRSTSDSRSRPVRHPATRSTSARSAIMAPASPASPPPPRTNGFGGRGVAPEVTLVAFNPLESPR